MLPGTGVFNSVVFSVVPCFLASNQVILAVFLLILEVTVFLEP